MGDFFSLLRALANLQKLIPRVETLIERIIILSKKKKKKREVERVTWMIDSSIKNDDCQIDLWSSFRSLS